MENLIAPHGGYKKLKTFQLAQLIFDLRGWQEIQMRMICVLILVISSEKFLAIFNNMSKNFSELITKISSKAYVFQFPVSLILPRSDHAYPVEADRKLKYVCFATNFSYKLGKIFRHIIKYG